ncbi:hypothetical protein GCM10009827_017070 [Dactylosporangium maewongense]|uniref:DUF397 domain-containing protein n=1 Tax=Dactylosporangium maewongense TaxID=634393 RepID=A0ABN1ZU55_9ACTN
MFDEQASTPQFRTACEGAGTCVEVATLANQVLVRDSKDPNGAVLAFTVSEWSDFVAGVKRGVFDIA